MSTSFCKSHQCPGRGLPCQVCRTLLTVGTAHFKPVSILNSNIFGLQVIGLSHLAKILVNYVDLSTYNNIWVGFATLWCDVYTNSNPGIRLCRKFINYHHEAKYSHAIVSVYFNQPVKNWNANPHIKRFYNTILSTKLVKFDDTLLAFQFVNAHPKELARIRSYINWFKSPFETRCNCISTLLPFYGEFLQHNRTGKIDKNNITIKQLKWFEEELRNACKYGLQEEFDIITSSGILRVLKDTDIDGLNVFLDLACGGNTGNKNTKLRIIKVLLTSGAYIPTFKIVFNYNFLAAAKVLYEKGSDLSDPVDTAENTVLHLACIGKRFEYNQNFFNWIFECEEITDIINIQNRHGETPLLVAISNYSDQYTYQICLKLINCLADVNIPDYAGETPLFVANACGLKKITNLLSQSGATPLYKKRKV